MRLAAALALAAITASPAAAQGAYDIHAQNRLAVEQDLARQQALAAQREAFVAGQRARTGAVLQTLTAHLPPLAPAPRDARMLTDAEAMTRIQDQALAASNARILAIKPASEP